MTALKLHGLGFSPSTARALTALNEKAVDYELQPVNFATRAHKQEPYLSLNPYGQVPALEDGDFKLFESRAITKYVASKYMETGPDLLRSDNIAEAALVNVWVEVEAQHYTPVIAPLVSELLRKPKLMKMAPDEAVVEELAGQLEKILDVYEERLSKSKYLAGDFYSLADLHHLPYTYCLLQSSKASLITSRPHVKAWWDDISSRPAWVKTAEGMKFWNPSPA
ncbi:glutathione S-transferase F13-like [Aristolochia californica]|uniref:glutathione S-transferase F13-like n=1 Tax=Aristolochia californica TaxID=171875 RepID=UPI0035DA71B8